MSKPVYFALSCGMHGYTPNSGPTAYCVTTRRELVSILRYELEVLDAPSSAFREFKVRAMWAWAKRNGFSSYHDSVDISDSEAMFFSGLTEDEYNAACRED